MAGPEDQLREIGWRKLEAQCYCALVEFGELTASEIAAHINARQEKVYQPLKLLNSKGYVLIQDENPQRYRAQNPRFVIRQERNNFRDDTNEIQRELQEAWEMAAEGIPETTEHAWVLSGKEGMRTEQARLFEDAEDRIVGYDSRLQFSAPYALDALEAKSRDGLEISIVGQENAEERLARLADADVHSSIYKGRQFKNMSFYISDGNEVLLRVSGGRAAVVFTDEYFANIMEFQYERICQEAEPVADER
ncbi:TrmB family transcriptional regulator [Haloarcula sp. JP-L23]|uniref:TrmB family transcriptional regulator n=1 Tax=Haloarcula sp. JP-L23 TaxID=2716717 RepID=UPI00140F3A54|nr:TrmB family transcriptional regulator [Haloarcula sp. JP-L23]